MHVVVGGLLLLFLPQNSLDSFSNNICPCNAMLFTVLFKTNICFFINSCLDLYCFRLFCFGASSSRAQFTTYFLCHNNTICGTKSQGISENFTCDFSRTCSLLSSLSSPNGCQLPVLAFRQHTPTVHLSKKLFYFSPFSTASREARFFVARNCWPSPPGMGAFSSMARHSSGL